jgi:hypothetical protein
MKKRMSQEEMMRALLKKLKAHQQEINDSVERWEALKRNEDSSDDLKSICEICLSQLRSYELPLKRRIIELEVNLALVSALKIIRQGNNEAIEETLEFIEKSFKDTEIETDNYIKSVDQTK